MPLLSRRCAAEKSSLRSLNALPRKAFRAFDPTRGGLPPPRAPRRAAAPSSSPANTRADSSEQRFFDKLKGGPGPPFTRPNKAHPLFREFIAAAKAG